MPPLPFSPDDADLYRIGPSIKAYTSDPSDSECIGPSIATTALVDRITQLIRDHQDEAAILSAFTQLIVESLASERCQIELYDADRTTTRVAYECAVTGGCSVGHQRQIRNFRALYQPLLAGSPSQFVELVPKWSPQSEKTTWLGCPIFDSQDVFGNLWLSRSNPDTFSLAEQHLAQWVASHCAIAIRQTRLHQVVQAQTAELTQLKQLQEDFQQLISHELLSPVSSIQLAVQTLEKLFTENAWLKPSQQKQVLKILGILQQGCKRQNTLMNDLLTLIIPGFKAQFEPVLIELQTWLPSLLRTFQKHPERENLHLTLALAPDLPAIESDSFYLERTLSELLTNAFKYTPADETITITATHQTDKVILAIENTGVEIPEQCLPHLFDKFYRIPELDRQNLGGTGLGLALVKKMVTEMGGQIQVVSQKRVTTFSVILPIHLKL
jgi:signal transduction histidine kinase